MDRDYPEYVDVNSIQSNDLMRTHYRIRKSLHIPLLNDYSNDLTYIMMNPSKADKNVSDDTVNRCLKIAYHFPCKYQIGAVTIVNMQPIYEPKSSKLEKIISNISHDEYINELIDNIKTIKKTVKKSDYIFLATGESPKGIDKKLYRGLLDMVVEYIEKNKGCIFLGKKINNKSFLTNSGYPRHIHPLRQGYLEIANLHSIKNLKFIATQNGNFNI